MNFDFKELHFNNLVVDAHCDTLSKILRVSPGTMPDYELFFRGGINFQIFALYTPEDLIPHSTIPFTLEMIDLCYKWQSQHPDKVKIVLSKKDLVIENDKFLCLLSIEGGEAIGEKLFLLDIYYRLGVRAMGLTWNRRNFIADGATVGNNPGGLTFFGDEVVKRMNQLGMIIDVSHMAEKGFWDVLNLSSKPVIASHSNCWALHNHPRNLKDEQILAIAKKGGVIGITFVPSFLAHGQVGIEQVVEHIEYIVNLTESYDFVGLGSDFDGTDKYPSGLDSLTSYPAITELLLNRGHSPEGIKKILGENWFRLFSEILT